jgi:hypothetical protein
MLDKIEPSDDFVTNYFEKVCFFQISVSFLAHIFLTLEHVGVVVVVFVRLRRKHGI